MQRAVFPTMEVRLGNPQTKVGRSVPYSAGAEH